MKIKKRLLVSILPVVAISILSVTTVAINISTKTIEHQVKENAKLLAESYSFQLDSKIKELKASSEEIASAIVTAVNVETVLIDARKRYLHLENIYYTSLDGGIKDMSPYYDSLLWYNYNNDENWKRAVKNKETVLSDPLMFLEEKRILIYSPVVLDYLASGESEVVGVIILTIKPEYIFSKLRSFVYGDTGSLFVINNDGLYLTHKDKNYKMKKKFLDTLNATDLSQIEASMRDQQSGFGTYYVGSEKNFVCFSPINETGWSLSLTGEYSEFTTVFNPIIFISIIILLVGIFITSILIYLIVRGVSNPLTQLTDIIEKISKGDFTLRSNIKKSNEVGQLSKAFDNMVERVEDFNNALEKEVDNRTEELLVANKELTVMNESAEVMNEELVAINETLDSNAREMESMNDALKVSNESLEFTNEELKQAKNALWSEMELAQKLQTILLPKNPKIDGFDIGAFMSPNNIVGGDYYDVINIEGRNWFLIGDVSGHGITSGLIMMMVQTSIHVALSQNPDADPKDLLSVINKTIHCNISKMGGNRYVTLTVFACLANNKISFAGAHLPVIIYRSDTDSIEVIETNGVWVGIIDDINNLNKTSDIYIKDGDVILLYTDGITEAVTDKGKLFSEQGLIDLFKKSVHLEPSLICTILQDYTKSLRTDDDMTALVLKKVQR